MIRRFLVWLGFAPTWFTIDEFERVVGHPACVRCLHANAEHPNTPAIFCEADLDAWFDAVLA